MAEIVVKTESQPMDIGFLKEFKLRCQFLKGSNIKWVEGHTDQLRRVQEEFIGLFPSGILSLIYDEHTEEDGDTYLKKLTDLLVAGNSEKKPVVEFDWWTANSMAGQYSGHGEDQATHEFYNLQADKNNGILPVLYVIRMIDYDKLGKDKTLSAVKEATRSQFQSRPVEILEPNYK